MVMLAIELMLQRFLTVKFKGISLSILGFDSNAESREIDSGLADRINDMQISISIQGVCDKVAMLVF
jgi:hypothetical protein